MQSIHKKHIGVISFFVIVVIGFLIVLNTFFDIQFVGNIFSRFVTIQASVIVLMVLALIHFLFITNLLHTSHREHSAVLSNITEGLVVLDAHKKITMMNVAQRDTWATCRCDTQDWDIARMNHTIQMFD
jgi:sensor histidine kinase regulating citrate/malate metabolism